MGILRHPYPVVMLALLLGAGWTWANRLPEGGLQAQVDVAPRTDFAAPPLTLNDLSGLPVDLGRFKGQVVVLNFWAAWCPPCRAEMPELDRVYRAHQPGGLLVLAVNEQEDAAFVDLF